MPVSNWLKRENAAVECAPISVERVVDFAAGF
jgi:hypothetical protein